MKVYIDNYAYLMTTENLVRIERAFQFLGHETQPASKLNNQLERIRFLVNETDIYYRPSGTNAKNLDLSPDIIETLAIQVYSEKRLLDALIDKLILLGGV